MKRLNPSTQTLGIIAGLFFAAACGTKSGAATKECCKREVKTAQGAVITRDYEGLETHFDFSRAEHLAEVDHAGTFIDFGTAARQKYTGGNWKSGWGSDRMVDGASATYVGASGRIYINVDNIEPLIVRTRLKPIGTGTLTVFINNKSLPTVQLGQSKAYREFDIPIPAEHLQKGENTLLLRFGGSVNVGGEAVSAAIDWMRVIAGAGPIDPRFVAPNYGSLHAAAAVGNEKRDAFVMPAPTTLSFYVNVPKNAQLGFAIGLVSGNAGFASVSATTDESPSKIIFQSKVTNTWSPQLISLAEWGDKVVRFDFKSESSAGQVAQIAWSEPKVLIKKAEPAPKDAIARNVVLLLIDTQRADKFKAFNAMTRVKTPAIDLLAKDGAIFTAAQAPENWTKPSVASVLTSLYPATHRAKTDDAKVGERALFLSEAFRQAGFSTASFIANGYVSDKFGFNQGWDYYTNYIREGKVNRAENVFKDAANWIEHHKDKRFFAYVQTIDPHVPYDPPKKFIEMYDDKPYIGQVEPRKTPEQLELAKKNPPRVTFTARDRERLEALYDGEVSYHDEHLAKFIERLGALGLLESTVFVVTADHGEELYDHQSFGHGHTVYQELINVPLMVRFPKSVPQGLKVSSTVSTIDIGPTVFDLAGLAVPKEFEGKSLTPYFRASVPQVPEVAFSDFLDDRRVIRSGDWKLILRGNQPTLFNLRKDPHEHMELNAHNFPVAQRHCRFLLGQFLGATERGHWSQPSRGGNARELEQEKAVIDPTTRDQLKALGYGQ